MVDSDWEIMRFNEHYEINRVDPTRMRRVGEEGEIGSSMRKDYLRISLDRQSYQLHRIIALQLMPNPENLKDIDHIDRNKLNNNIENLRWCSGSTNNFNLTRYNGLEAVYVSVLPDDAFIVDEYGTHRFNHYHYSLAQDKFYSCVGPNQYKILRINTPSSRPSKFVNMKDTNNKNVCVMLKIFRKIYTLDE
jgi:hypothetical protein